MIALLMITLHRRRIEFSQQSKSNRLWVAFYRATLL